MWEVGPLVRPLSPEVEYLKQLVDEEQWDKIPRYAERLLFQGANLNPEDLAWINFAICRVRCLQNEPYAAIPPGELAKKLAKDRGLWDLLARIFVSLNFAYLQARQYDRVLSGGYEYLQYITYYSVGRNREGHIWMQIGGAYEYTGDYAGARKAFERARRVLELSGDAYWADECRRRLIEVSYHLDPDHVPSLIEQGESYVADHPNDNLKQALQLYDRAKWALYKQEYHESTLWAQGALDATRQHKAPMVEGVQFGIFMVLSHVSRALGDAKSALSYALSARMVAITGKFFALEFEAANHIHDLLSCGATEAVQTLDREYLEAGLDMTYWLGDVAVQERREVT